MSKTRCGGTMTESAWLAWVRSALRSKSLKWPPRNAALQLARRPYKGESRLQKWEYQCAMCQGWFKAKEVIVDHFPKAAGSILCVADIGEFANNLFCETDNLRVLDKICHDIHTLAEKNGISLEEAKIQKKVIESCKLKTDVQLAMLSALCYHGCTNAAKRKLAWTEIHTKEAAGINPIKIEEK
jgi:hypothetical protein